MKPFAMPGKSQFLYVWINCWDPVMKTVVRRQRSTKTSNRKEAEKEGFRLQEKEDAKKEASQKNQQTIRQMCRDYVAALVGILPETTISNYTNCAEICIEALGDYADQTKLDKDAPPLVRKFLYQHYNGNTVEDRGRFCKRMLLHVIKVTGGELWWLDDFKVDSQSDGDESPREMFTEDQKLALRKACRTDEERAFLSFAENLGGRISDMIRLRGSGFNPTKRNLRYLNSKTVKICGTWLWPENQKYVESVIAKAGVKDPILFPTFNRNDPRDVQRACAWFAKKLKAAGIRCDADLIATKPGLTKVEPSDKKRKRDKRYRHSFHSYRVTLISILASIGVPLHVIMDIVGHKDPRTTRRYIRTLDEDVQAASMLHGTHRQGDWQQLANQSMAYYLGQAVIAKADPQAAEPPPMPVATPRKSNNKHALIETAAAHPVRSETNLNAATFVVAGGTRTGSQLGNTFEPLVPIPKKQDASRRVLSANSMHKDTLMLSSVPKGWPGLKPK